MLKHRFILVAGAIPLFWGAVALAQNAGQPESSKEPWRHGRHMGGQMGEWNKGACADHYARKPNS